MPRHLQRGYKGIEPLILNNTLQNLEVSKDDDVYSFLTKHLAIKISAKESAFESHTHALIGKHVDKMGNNNKSIQHAYNYLEERLTKVNQYDEDFTRPNDQICTVARDTVDPFNCDITEHMSSCFSMRTGIM